MKHSKSVFSIYAARKLQKLFRGREASIGDTVIHIPTFVRATVLVKPMSDPFMNSYGIDGNHFRFHLRKVYKRRKDSKYKILTRGPYPD
jgi:hypothetical protein